MKQRVSPIDQLLATAVTVEDKILLIQLLGDRDLTRVVTVVKRMLAHDIKHKGIK